jgi:two-component system, NarL family, response regulator NreC
VLAPVWHRLYVVDGQVTVSTDPQSGTKVFISVPANPQPATTSLPAPTPTSSTSPPSPKLAPTPSSSSTGSACRELVIADANPLARLGLMHVLDSLPDYCVVAQVASPSALTNILNEAQDKEQAAVVVLDVSIIVDMAQIQEIMHALGTHNLLVLTGNPEDVFAWEAIRGGASSILKADVVDILAEALEATRKGQQYISDDMAQFAVMSYLHNAPQPAPLADELAVLTPRERDILAYVAADFQNTQIADTLTISVRTVETHRANMMRKLGLKTKADIIKFALRKGLISLTENKLDD